MKPKDEEILHNKTSCDYAFQKCEELGIDPEENALCIAECFEDGYTKCFTDLSMSQFINPDETKIDKSVANEYAAIAHNAIAQLLLNYPLSPLSEKQPLLDALKVLDIFYNLPL